MNGRTHRALAAATWLATAQSLGVTGWAAVAAVGPAVAFSAGPTSPDLDNTRFAKWMDGLIPGPDPFGHRRLAHWWAPPLAAALTCNRMGEGWPRTLLLAACVGWLSHLLGDLVFGKRGMGTPRGVPVAPWWWHVGVGFKVGTAFERTVAGILTLGAVYQLAAVAGWARPVTAFVEALAHR